MKGYRTETHDILIEFEGDGLALADEVRKLRGVLAEAYVVKPLVWDGDDSYQGAEFVPVSHSACFVNKIYGPGETGYHWSFQCEDVYGEGDCATVEDGKRECERLYLQWLGKYLEKVEL